MGGAWKRLICLTRRISCALMKKQVVTDEVLNILMAKTKSILDSRPLVPIIFDLDKEPLTPSQLLLLRGSVNLPPGPFQRRNSCARQRWAQTQYLADEFWRRWVKEFLQNITYRQKWR